MNRLTKQFTGTYVYGFFLFCALAKVKSYTISVILEQETEEAKPIGIPYYKTIIYPVGNSELAEKGAEITSKICKMSGTQFILLYVEDKWHGIGRLAPDSPEWQ